MCSPTRRLAQANGTVKEASAAPSAAVHSASGARYFDAAAVAPAASAAVGQETMPLRRGSRPSVARGVCAAAPCIAAKIVIRTKRFLIIQNSISRRTKIRISERKSKLACILPSGSIRSKDPSAPKRTKSCTSRSRCRPKIHPVNDSETGTGSAARTARSAACPP